MARIHLFEFTDLPWYPNLFRAMQTDYLQFSASMGSGHKNLLPLFQKALRNGKTQKIVDLCSGGMGPWKNLSKQLQESGLQVSVLLTDKFPNPNTIAKVNRSPAAGIAYCPVSVDATDVPREMQGMRTLFEGFHHFKPAQARAILQDAREKQQPIGVFEASLISPLGYIFLIFSPIITFLTYWLVTPFMRPFSIARIIWTYLLPVVPLATCWDGIISLLRVYSTAELNDLADSLRSESYAWEIGRVSTGTPIFDFTYIIGYPKTL